MHLPHITPFSRSPIYFFTACVQGRRPILANAEAQMILDEIWRNSASYDGWFVGRFMIMPNHVHFFATPNGSAKSRVAWCKTWKSVTSRRLAKALGIAPPIWQPDTFDHILRSADSYSEKWEYVAANPVRAGLSVKKSDWPWQGEIHSLAF